MSGMSTATAEVLGRLVSRALVARAEESGRPFVVAHWVTNRCSCRCASCLWRHNDWQDVPLDELKRFYAEAREEGFVAAALSGGEPFLRKDLGQLVRYLKEELGFALLTFTTGWHMARRHQEVLPWLDALVMSLDSARRERHDAIRGLPGLYDRVMAATEMIPARYPELSYQLNVCVQQGIAGEIDDLLALAERRGLRLSFDVITDFRNATEGTHAETPAGLPLPELRAVCGRLAELKRAGAPIVNSTRYFDYFAAGKPGYRCHLPKIAMAIDGRGNVEDCLRLDRPIANIRETPLREILALPRFRQLRADAERCSTCSSPTMVDMSHIWEEPHLVFEPGGLAVG